MRNGTDLIIQTRAVGIYYGGKPTGPNINLEIIGNVPPPPPRLGEVPPGGRIATGSMTGTIARSTGQAPFKSMV